MSDWLKKIGLWLKLVERDLDANPYSYIFDRLGNLEERVAILETRIDNGSTTAAP